MLLKPCHHGCKRNPGGGLERISVNAHGYAAECDGATVVFRCLDKAVPIAVRQNLRLVELAFVPDWPDCMDDVLRGQIETWRFYCLSWLARAAEIVEIPIELWAGGIVDRAIHSSASKKRDIRRVDDRVNILKHDAIAIDFDSHA